MCQWSYDRKTAFLQFCNQQGVGWPNNDITVQFNFMLQELQGGDWMYVGHDYGYSKNTRKSLEEFNKTLLSTNKLLSYLFVLLLVLLVLFIVGGLGKIIKDTLLKYVE